jgi:plastocyanin
MMLSRRRLLAAGGGFLAGSLAPPLRAAEPAIIEIRMRSDAQGGHVGFDPVGILVAAGQTIRWRCQENVHTTTAYHPDNDKHSLRIPEGAKPWDSGFLLPGESFDLTLSVEGVYDYYCRPHEQAGMVGRIIVGRAAGPGSLAFDYFSGRPDASGWIPVPEAAQKAFPAIAEIMQRRIVPGMSP